MLRVYQIVAPDVSNQESRITITPDRAALYDGAPLARSTAATILRSWRRLARLTPRVWVLTCNRYSADGRRYLPR